MIEAEFAKFMLNGGVAVGVCIWFMFRNERVVNNNTKALQEVRIAVATCPKKEKNN